MTMTMATANNNNDNVSSVPVSCSLFETLACYTCVIGFSSRCCRSWLCKPWAEQALQSISRLGRTSSSPPNIYCIPYIKYHISYTTYKTAKQQQQRPQSSNNNDHRERAQRNNNNHDDDNNEHRRRASTANLRSSKLRSTANLRAQTYVA